MAVSNTREDSGRYLGNTDNSKATINSCDDKENEVSRYGKKIRIPNTDKATETAMNFFVSFVLNNEDVQKYVHLNARFLDIAHFHDADHKLEKNNVRDEERNIVTAIKQQAEIFKSSTTPSNEAHTLKKHKLSAGLRFVHINSNNEFQTAGSMLGSLSGALHVGFITVRP